jgi:D-alanyl-D-alanine carboxypeptidase
VEANVLFKIMTAAVIMALYLLTSTPPLGNSPREPGPSYRSFVAWSPDNLPPDVETTLNDLPGVKATTVRAGIDWMTSSESAYGKTIDHPPVGFSIPLEMLVVKPKEYSQFVASVDRDAIGKLKGDDVVLARTERKLRGAGKGLRLSVGRALRVTGVVSNDSTEGYEGLLPAPVPASWSKASRFVLIKAKRSVSAAKLRRTIGSKLAPGQKLRLHSQSQTRYLRYADAVQPPLIIKKNFGEFSARPAGSGYELDESWMTRYLRRESVPILGSFTCNRKLFPQLRGAMQQIQSEGLAHLIHPREFAGCFNPRLIPSAHSTQLSHHAWGAAVDINSLDNPFGAEPRQDPRLVKIMQRWGLTWGGSWLVPDGMHFEWKRFP